MCLSAAGTGPAGTGLDDGRTAARTTGAAHTSARLGEAWPEVAERLGKLLACRGVDPLLAEDIVQDVAVRALDKQVPFTDPNDLYRWAAVAARNIHIDHMRCGGRTTEVESLVGVPDGTDVAYAVERRVALGHVWRAIAVLRPGEREAILGTLDDDRTARTSGALVRRHRARATLRKAVGGMIAACGAARLRGRSFSPMLRTAGAVAVLTPVMALDLGGGGLGALHAGRGPGADGTAPAVVVQTVRAARTMSDSRLDAPARATTRGTAARVVARAADPGASVKPVYVPRRDDHPIAAPLGGADFGQKPKQPGNPTLCVNGIPDPSDSVCTQEVPLPTL